MEEDHDQCISCNEARATVVCDACERGVFCEACALDGRRHMISNACPLCRAGNFFKNLSTEEAFRMQEQRRQVVQESISVIGADSLLDSLYSDGDSNSSDNDSNDSYNENVLSIENVFYEWRNSLNSRLMVAAQLLGDLVRAERLLGDAFCCPEDPGYHTLEDEFSAQKERLQQQAGALFDDALSYDTLSYDDSIPESIRDTQNRLERDARELSQRVTDSWSNYRTRHFRSIEFQSIQHLVESRIHMAQCQDRRWRTQHHTSQLHPEINDAFDAWTREAKRACEAMWNECLPSVARDDSALHDARAWAEYYVKEIEIEDKKFRLRRTAAEKHRVRALRLEVDVLVARSSEDRNTVVRKAMSDMGNRGVEYEILRGIAEELLRPDKANASSDSDGGCNTGSSSSPISNDGNAHFRVESYGEFKSRYDDMIPYAGQVRTGALDW